MEHLNGSGNCTAFDVKQTHTKTLKTLKHFHGVFSSYDLSNILSQDNICKTSDLLQMFIMMNSLLQGIVER